MNARTVFGRAALAALFLFLAAGPAAAAGGRGYLDLSAGHIFLYGIGLAKTFTATQVAHYA